MNLQNRSLALLAFLAVGMAISTPAAAQKKPNIVMLMTDDTRSPRERPGCA
jgi:ABC-type sugar transport system substrate-binding protein